MKYSAGALFTPDEALAYLTTVLDGHGRTEPADELAALADDLGHLPLALSQAATYLLDADLGCAAYRALLADRARTLADVLPSPSALPDDQPTSVAAAWSLSIDRADQLSPQGLARPLLQFTAVLDPNGIPAKALEDLPALNYLAARRAGTAAQPVRSRRWPWRRPHPEPVTVAEVRGALRILHCLSLIEHTPDTSSEAVRVHQLIQRAAREALAPQEYDGLARAAADALLAAWPEVENDTAFAQALRANTAVLASHAEDALYRPGVHELLYRVGISLGEAGQVAAADAHYRHLVDAARDRLGPDHPDSFLARGELARWRGEAGDAAGAADALKELLSDLRQLPNSRDSRYVLFIRGNLARWRGEAGDAAGAADAFKELLPDMQRVRGPNHPHTLGVRGGIAEWQGRTGDAAGAADAFQELLADYLRILGPNDQQTLLIRGRLALWRAAAGDAAGAAEASEELLPDLRQVLGPDNPETLAIRGLFAQCQGTAGDAAGAADAFKELLPDLQRVVGPDHSITQFARSCLAHWRGDAEGGAQSAE
ncbi:tetratricopeptide repeat protein [Streptomyces sp. NPDC052101]|uniref:tetratricopeptide repeat protein n=1 Tax=Streptomyces sp. NPDC052101 TaxID=3155763 RepID=UPI00342A743D